VFAAAAIAGLSGSALPLGGGHVGTLGIAQTERPTDVVHAVGAVLQARPEISTTALALAVVAILMPRALARGPWGIAGLGALQVTLVLAWAPSIPWLGVVVGTWLLCGLLAARPLAAAIGRRSAR
jgi:hypothetical protein